MATSTTNYNLSKPSYSDTADIAVINENMDKIDTAIKNVSDMASINAANISALRESVSHTLGKPSFFRGNGTVTVKRIGKLAILSLTDLRFQEGFSPTAAYTWQKFGDLPSGFTPDNVYVAKMGGTAGKTVSLNVKTDGTINMYFVNETYESTYVSGEVVFFIA